MNFKKIITKKVIVGLFFCLFSATYLPMKAMESPTTTPAITESSDSVTNDSDIEATPPAMPSVVSMQPDAQVVALTRMVRLKNFWRKAVANEWPRTGIKATFWEGVIATSLTALALEWATDFQTPIEIAYLAGISNQAVEFLMYVPYDRAWNWTKCFPKLRDNVADRSADRPVLGAEVLRQLSFVTNSPSGSTAPLNPDPTDSPIDSSEADG